MSPREPPSSSSSLTTTDSAPTPTNQDVTASAATRANGTNPKKRPHQLQATENMCYHCFDVLLEHFQSRLLSKSSSSSSLSSSRSSLFFSSSKSPQTNDPMATATTTTTVPVFQPSSSFSLFVQDLPHDSVECPLFVTWDKLKQGHFTLSSTRAGLRRYTDVTHPQRDASNNNNHTSVSGRAHYDLRGCIGTLSARPVQSALGEYALTSSLKDRRFDPVALEEIPTLRVAVSLLVQYESCRDCWDWTVGVHGILIKFYISNSSGNILEVPVEDDDASRRDKARKPPNGREYSATYLPEVAAEQKWDQRTTLHSLIRKSGYHGAITDHFLQHIQCTRYQSSKCLATYDDYVQNGCGGNNPIDALLALEQQQSPNRSYASSSSFSSNSQSQGQSSQCIIL